MSGDRTQRLRERLLSWSPQQRQALARRLADREGSGRLVALVVSDDPTVPQDLADRLARQLPAHMVPSRVVSVPRLPRTAAGKLDRSALPALAAESPLESPMRRAVGPRTPTEVTLTRIWADVLGVEEIDPEDDFFEIGGDSLLSIRVIARAGREGLPIDPEMFFERPTIAALAARLSDGSPRETPGPDAVQGTVTGTAPLTPIQQWFLERIPDGRDQWNQCLVVEMSESPSMQGMRSALEFLHEHHDGLRLRLRTIGDGEWTQDLRPSSAVHLSEIDAADLPEPELLELLRRQLAAEQAQMRLDEGGLLRGLLVRRREGPDRLVLLAHHLIVDGHSWSILLEDLETLLRQVREHRPLRLPPKTHDVRAWAERLVGRAGDDDVKNSAPHWLAQPEGPHLRVPAGETATMPSNRAADAAHHTLRVDPSLTGELLKSAASRVGATPQQMLLASLAMAWREWHGMEELLLDLEGHGRDLVDGLDVSRTVGWFTTVYPVWITAESADPRANLDAVKRALQGTGMGGWHGLLRYLGPDPDLRQGLASRQRAEILFNYLGQMDSLVSAGSELQLRASPDAPMRSPQGPRAYVLEINARVEGDSLLVDLEYSRAMHAPEQIEQLASGWLAAMGRVCKAEPTLSPWPGFGASELERIGGLLADLDQD